MPKLFYNLFIKLYPFLINLISPFNAKAKQWIDGRKGIFEKMAGSINAGDKIIWMHCASLGEFEQGRPLLERLKSERNDLKILLTFFSPSGYEVRKNYQGADYIFYLPMDSLKNSKLFFEIVKPTLILFVKYEFWFYYLREAKERQIPLLLVSGIFRKDQPFFKWYGTLHRQMLQSFTHFFLQNGESQDLLNKLGLRKKTSISGDTRFDRVIEIAEAFEPIREVEAFCNAQQVIVAGSTWTDDDKELNHYANSNSQVKFIIAPHNIGTERIKECLHLYKNAFLFSELIGGKSFANKNTLIIDNVGMLSRLYCYATICYIGGGFGEDGVHNVLEAAVYGKPVVFGPEYSKFIEAVDLVELGGATTIGSAIELEATFTRFLQDKNLYDRTSKIAKNYVYNNQGATEKIINYIQENRLLTN